MDKLSRHYFLYDSLSTAKNPTTDIFLGKAVTSFILPLSVFALLQLQTPEGELAARQRGGVRHIRVN